MAKDKHTPAPWRIIGDEIVSYEAKNSFWTNNTGDPAIICQLGFWCTSDGNYKEFDNHKNNAHLIAAAPELLEALEEAHGIIREEYTK